MHADFSQNEGNRESVCSGSLSRRKRIKDRKRLKETGGNAHKEFSNNNVAWLCDLENGTEHPNLLSWVCSHCLQEIKASGILGNLDYLKPRYGFVTYLTM